MLPLTPQLLWHTADYDGPLHWRPIVIGLTYCLFLLFLLFSSFLQPKYMNLPEKKKNSKIREIYSHIHNQTMQQQLASVDLITSNYF